jgi:dTDP-glucose 4,6-dehydratase
MHFASPASPNPSSPYGYLNLPIQTMKAGALGTHNTLGVARARERVSSWPPPVRSTEIHLNILKPSPTGVMSIRRAKVCLRRGQALRRGFNDGLSPLPWVDARIVRIFNTYGPRMHLDDGAWCQISCNKRFWDSADRIWDGCGLAVFVM